MKDNYIKMRKIEYVYQMVQLILENKAGFRENYSKQDHIFSLCMLLGQCFFS